MKKLISIISLIIVFALAAAFYGCGSDEDGSDDKWNSVGSPTPETTAEVNATSAPDSQPTVFEVPVERLPDIKHFYYGTKFKFGKYEQDNNKDNGPEDIEWIVIGFDGDKVLALTCNVLTNLTFNDVMWEKSLWEKCKLRNNLNGQFYAQSFTDEEKAMIVESELLTDGKVTKDKVFLLSQEEVEEYLTTELSRLCYATDYAYSMGAYRNEEGFSQWWLRSQFDRNSRVTVVDGKGQFLPNYPFNGGGGVRPAIWLIPA
ncbi:MAG: hypothetical protein ILO42_08520 [Clostridia bacterium]|nr:hypothetical protein [Clostridia bacterium]